MNELEDEHDDEDPPWWVLRGYELQRLPPSRTNNAGMYGPVAVAVDATWTWGMAQSECRQRQTFTGRWREET